MLFYTSIPLNLSTLVSLPMQTIFKNNLPSPLPINHQFNRKGFSLIELLVVIAIIAIMTGLGVPAVLSLGKTGNLTQATTDLALSLEQARAYAMAHNTYVWVGLDQTSNDEVICAIVAGSNGQQTDINNADNYSPIFRAKKFSNIKLLGAGMPTQSLPGMSANVANITESAIGSLQTKVAGQARSFSDVLQFSPVGEAIVSSSSLPRWVQIGFNSATGTKDNFSVLQVSALTGQVRIFRP